MNYKISAAIIFLWIPAIIGVEKCAPISLSEERINQLVNRVVHVRWATNYVPGLSITQFSVRT